MSMYRGFKDRRISLALAMLIITLFGTSMALAILRTIEATDFVAAASVDSIR